MFKKIALGQVRHFLTTAGGGFVAQGLLTGDELNIIIGGAITLLGVLWSAYDKKREESK